MSAVFAMGNKCYTGRDAIYDKITEYNERTEGMLVLRFSEGQGNIVLKLCGEQLNDSEMSSEPKFYTVNLTFRISEVVFWGSYPIESGKSLSNDFSVPFGYVTSSERPKRWIHFQAKCCHVAKTEIPRLVDPYLEQRMKQLVASVRESMAEGRTIYFKCVVDEYRADRGVFQSIRESIEAEKPPFCTRCQKYGHEWTDCGGPKCGRCGAVGHDDNSCPSAYCRGCGTRGHSLQQCP